MVRAVAQFNVLFEAFEFVNFGLPAEYEAYFCTTTGAIHYHSEYGDNEEPLPDDIEDAEKYIAIPHKNDLDLGKRLVLKFAGAFLPDALGEVREIFGHSGAYAHFKELLEHRGMLQQWYEYEVKAQKESLREWCEAKGIEIDG